MSHRQITFVLRDVKGEKWCSLAAMGVKHVDVVAYKMNITENFVLTGGHRHRKVRASDDVHLLIPPIEKPVNIANVAPVSAPAQQRHGRRR